MAVKTKKVKGKACPDCETEMVALIIGNAWMCPACMHTEPLRKAQ